MKRRAAAKRGASGNKRAKRAASRRTIRLGARPKTAEALMRKVQRISAALLVELPHLDPGEVSLIVESLLRPAAQRVIFVRPLGNGIGNVF